MTNTNLQFRNELAREQGLTRYGAMDLIADRSQAIAEISNCTFMGIDKRGATFCVVIHDSATSVLTPYLSFSYETVIDSPSEIITWARETRKKHTPNSATEYLVNMSGA